MDTIMEQSKENNNSHANKLPVEIVGRFLQNLSVNDRLKNERVSPLWKRALSKWGWTEQRKLEADIVFEGASSRNVARFWKNLDNHGICHNALLLHQIGLCLRELDLHSFGWINIQRFLQQIVESFESLKKLEKLDIGGLRLLDFIDHLPSTLRALEISDRFDIQNLEELSDNCPNLEEVPFPNLQNKNDLETEDVIKLIGKFLRQKKLNLFGFKLRSETQGALASIGELKTLVELNLQHSLSLDGESLEAIVGGCEQLRSLTFGSDRLTEEELFQLAKFPNLTVLNVLDRSGEFRDTVLKAIAQRGKLKKLYVFGSESNETLTDNSIVYMIDRCKSLISLRFSLGLQITERSLEAIVTEVRRRHGTIPKTLPTGDFDPRIFYFGAFATQIDEGRAEELIAGNPWLRFDDYDPREII